jgi:hypothetical protein
VCSRTLGKSAREVPTRPRWLNVGVVLVSLRTGYRLAEWRNISATLFPSWSPSVHPSTRELVFRPLIAWSRGSTLSSLPNWRDYREQREQLDGPEHRQ